MSRTKLKQRVQEKLKQVQEQRDEIVQFLEGVVEEANSAASGLLSITDKSKFQNKYKSTMQILEGHLNTLILIKDSLPGEGESSDDSGSDEDNEEEPQDDDSENLRQTERTVTSAVSSTPDRSSPEIGLDPESGASQSKGSDGGKHQGDVDVVPRGTVGAKSSLNEKAGRVGVESERNIEVHSREKKTERESNRGENAAEKPGSPDLGAEQIRMPSPEAVVDTQPSERSETACPEREFQVGALESSFDGQIDSIVHSSPVLPDLLEPSVPTIPEHNEDLTTVSMDAFMAQSAQTEQNPPPPSSAASDDPLVMPPPFNSRVFRRKKREITGKEASINMIMNSLCLKRDTLKTVNQVQEVLAAEKMTSSAAADNMSQVSAGSGLRAASQKSQSCLSLKSLGNVSAVSSSFTTDYGLGPDIPSLTFQDGDEIKVVLLEVLNPSMFWVRPEGAELDTLLEAMFAYYSKLLDKNGLGCEPKVGMVCAARFTQDDMWYRAKIIGLAPDQNVSIHECKSESGQDQSFGPYTSPVDRFIVEVMYVDYGNQEKLSDSRLWRLVPEFCQMPIQAFCSALARVLPLDEQKWQVASHILYAYSTMTLSGTLSTEPNCPVLLLDIQIPGLNMTFSEYLVRNNHARNVTNEEIAKSFLGVENDATDSGPAVLLEAVKSMSPKMSSESSLSQSLGQGDSVPKFDFGDGVGHGAILEMNDLQGANDEQSSDSNNESARSPSTDEWKNRVDENLENLLDEALAAKGEDRDCDHEMKLSGDEPQSPVSGRLEEMSTVSESPKSNVAEEDEAPDGWITLQLGAPTQKLKSREVEVPRNGCVRFMMSHINDPGDFYIHLVDQQTSKVLDELNKDLNKEYNKYMKSMMERFLQDDFVPKVNDLCCACFTQDSSYYRALILEIRKVTKGVRRAGLNKQRLRRPQEKEETTEIKILYFDFGNIEWVPGSKVYPLIPRFCNIPAQAVHCTLADLQPTGITGRWCTNATKLFERLTGYEKSFLGYVIENSDKVSEPIPLAILNVDDESWVNATLVEKRLAVAIASQVMDDGTDSKYDDADEKLRQEMDQWNPMMEDYMSERNSLMVDVDDPCVAITGYKDDPDQRPCKFYGKTERGCWRGDTCPYVHVDPKDDGCYSGQKMEAYCLYDPETIQTPDVDSWLKVTVSAIFNPGHFYVNFPCGTESLSNRNRDRDDDGYEDSHLPSSHCETLEMMTQALNEHCCQITRRDREMMGLAPGEIVAAKFSGNSTWCRAKVVDADTDEGTVEVFYVDFGNTEWLPESHIRLMEPQFLHMPFQAVECFLANVEAIDGHTWMKDSREFFRELVDGKPLFAHVIAREPTGVLQIDLYDTDIEDVHINKRLVAMGFARFIDPCGSESPSSIDSGRPTSRVSSRSSVRTKNKYNGGDVEIVFRPG